MTSPIVHTTVTLRRYEDGWKQWSFERPLAFGEEEGRWAESYLAVCPICKAIWAEVKVEEMPQFNVRPMLCSRHEPILPFNPVPGSILSEEGLGRIDEEMLKALPTDLLTRELQLHLRGTEK